MFRNCVLHLVAFSMMLGSCRAVFCCIALGVCESDKSYVQADLNKCRDEYAGFNKIAPPDLAMMSRESASHGPVFTPSEKAIVKHAAKTHCSDRVVCDLVGVMSAVGRSSALALINKLVPSKVMPPVDRDSVLIRTWHKVGKGDALVASSCSCTGSGAVALLIGELTTTKLLSRSSVHDSSCPLISLRGKIEVFDHDFRLSSDLGYYQDDLQTCSTAASSGSRVRSRRSAWQRVELRGRGFYNGPDVVDIRVSNLTTPSPQTSVNTAADVSGADATSGDVTDTTKLATTTPPVVVTPTAKPSVAPPGAPAGAKTKSLVLPVPEQQ